MIGFNTAIFIAQLLLIAWLVLLIRDCHRARRKLERASDAFGEMMIEGHDLVELMRRRKAEQDKAQNTTTATEAENKKGGGYVQ